MELLNKKYQLPQTVLTALEIDKDIILTEKEIIEAVMVANRNKKANIHREQYKNKLLSDTSWKPFDYEDLEMYFQQRYFELFEKDFDYNEFTEPVIEKILKYFANDKSFESLGDGYSLRKGLFIIGPVGVGKTSIFRALQAIVPRQFRIVHCEKDVEQSYSEAGSSCIDAFVEVKYQSDQRPRGCLFDDFGTESVANHFGNRKSVMDSIIQAIYPNRTHFNCFHIVSNLYPKDLTEKYDGRTVDRMVEMFNFIKFNPDTPSKRA